MTLALHRFPAGMATTAELQQRADKACCAHRMTGMKQKPSDSQVETVMVVRYVASLGRQLPVVQGSSTVRAHSHVQ